MIVLKDLTKFYRSGRRGRPVIDRINAVFPSRRVIGLLGRNGAGKSTLLRLIAGTARPDGGQVLSTGTISFPIGFAGSFHPDLSGAQNARFVARIYGADTAALLSYAHEVSELGEAFYAPFRSYSSGMKSRLAFAVSMGLHFDTYLVDEISAVGDAAFRRKSQAVFADRMRNAGAIFVSHAMGQMRELCNAGAVLEHGKLHLYGTIDEAISHHQALMGAAR